MTSPLIIRDVTLRDGLQNLPQVLPTADKLAVLDLLISAGVPDVQVTSFVNPKRIPQLADAEEMFAASRERKIEPNVLVANAKGFDRAIAAGAKSIDAVVSASNAYNKKNANRSTEEGALEIEAMLKRPEAAQCEIGIGLANSFHCFFEGEIDPNHILNLTRRFHTSGAQIVWLSDTTGHATPTQVTSLVKACGAIGIEVGLHLHDTQGRAGENAIAGYEVGVRKFDTSLSGLGGSPFTPGVGGNFSLETALKVFGQVGVETGIDAGKLEHARERLAGSIATAKMSDGADTPD